LLLLLITPGDLPGGDEKKPVPCHICKKSGVVPCKEHKRDELEKEKGFFRCSEFVVCSECRGTFFKACGRCSNKPEPKALKAWEENEAWLKEMREIDNCLSGKRRKSRIIHAESDHFIITFNVAKITVGLKGVKLHGAAHLYLERLEKLFEDVNRDLGVTEKDYLAKTHVMIWEREKDLVKTALKYCRHSSNTKSYMIGAKPIFTIYYNKGYLHEEFELHQAVVHNVVHCLLSNVWDGIWPGNIRGGWVDAGFAHHYELKYFGHLGGVRNYCYREGDSIGNFKFGKWEPTVLTYVRQKRTLSFFDVTSKNTDLLNPSEHMHSWSYVDFILKKHPDRFGEVCRLVKQRKPIAEVTKKALGMTPFRFEEAWKEYVKTNYRLKPKKGKKR